MVTSCQRTPLGWARLTVSGKRLAAVDFVDKPAKSGVRPDAASRRWSRELADYFAGRRSRFSKGFLQEGTPFQRRVWAELMKIGYGKTVSYKELAAKAGRPRAVRAVAGAVARNPLAVVVPCHRVIGHDGRLSGYAFGPRRKRWLLEHEAGVSGKRSKRS